MLNATQFSRLLAESRGITYQHAKEITDTVFSMLGEVLYERGEDVGIYGVGSFKHKVAKEKNTRHPATGEIIRVPERVYIKFNESEARTINSVE